MVATDDQRLFRAYAVNDLVERDILLKAFTDSGILEGDPRASSLFKAMSQADKFLTFDRFRMLQESSHALFDKVLTESVAISISEFSNQLSQIFDEVSPCTDGHLADYIPQLSPIQSWEIRNGRVLNRWAALRSW